MQVHDKKRRYRKREKELYRNLN